MKLEEIFHRLVSKPEKLADRMHRQHEIMSRLVERKDADPCDMEFIFDEITRSACDGLNTSRVSIWLYNDDHSVVHCAYAYDQKSGAIDIFEEMIVSRYPSYFAALESGAVIVEQNLAGDTRTHELTTSTHFPDNTEALLHMPIWVEGENIGQLCCEQTVAKRNWTLADQNFVRSITGHIAMAMSNCRRNKAEQHLKESEQRYELAVNGSTDGLWDWNLVTNKIYRSVQYKKLLGYAENEMDADPDLWSMHIHPEDRRRAQAALDAHLVDAGIIYDDEFRLRTKSGKYRWFRCRGSALRDDDGKPCRIAGSITDINELKYIQRSLNRFKQTLGEISENIFMFDPDSLKYFYANKSAITDSGYTETELMNMTPFDFKPEHDERSFRKLLSILDDREDKSLMFEAVHRCKDGSKRTVEVNLKYIAPANAPPRYVSIVRDITERRRADVENYIQRTMLEHIYNVQDDFISGKNRKSIFEQLINGILDITESEIGFIGEVIAPDDGSPYIRSRHIAGLSWDENAKEETDGIELSRLDNLLSETVRRRDILIAEKPELNTFASGLPQGHPPLETYMGIPLMLGDSMMGVIGIANRAAGYDSALIKQLQPLLSTCTNLLEAERAEEERSNMELALVEAKVEAEKANKSKSEFLSSMSHELRTPLNAIMGFSQILQYDEQLTDIQKNHAEVIYSAGGLLLELVNDVLDLAKIEAGKVNLSIEAVSVSSLMQESYNMIMPFAEKHDVKVIYKEYQMSTPHIDNIWARADNTRLKQVLLNLLSNAIKYNRQGGDVKISCSPDIKGMHRIRIEDSGQGISEKNIKRLFQPFNRLGAQNSEIEGTGIGLVITRRLVELMGGRINVESEHGIGTTFTVDIPVAEIPKYKTELTPNLTEEIGGTSLRNRQILVAEDNETNQELITLQLESLGHTPVVVSNGSEAFAELHKHEYDLLLTDIHMPVMDGYGLTRAIRESNEPNLRNLTIIAVTANAANSEASRCLEKGMDDYLSKPISIDDLQACLNRWLSTADVDHTEVIANQQVDIDSVEQPETDSSNKRICDTVIDRELLLRYIGEDKDKHERFFKLFLKTAPDTVEALHRSYAGRSLTEIRFSSHKLKSSANALGASRLTSLCQQLETAADNDDWNSIDEAMLEVEVVMSAVVDYIEDYLDNTEEDDTYSFAFDDMMIIDDDAFVRDLMISQLDSLGINKVKTASSGDEALATLQRMDAPPSVLLLDLNMPSMDGVEFMRHLAQQAYTGNIILFSAEDTRLLRSAENIAKDRNLNILGALEKPVNIVPLSKLLLRVGEQQRARPLRDKVDVSKDELRRGIEQNELIVYFQPQIDIASQQLSGVEALVRWIHPDKGMIPPDAFIPVAEELGLINDMTDIIMSKAMQQCASWRDQGLDTKVSINLSVDSLDRLELPEYIVACANKYRVDVSCINLEITESRLMQDITSALDILTRLSLKGIGLSIDDFGTGYSSMEQLQRIPFKELKIDRSFVNGAAHNKAARTILQSSVELAQNLNMTIVAEGVEDEDELQLVKDMGCTTAQGYYIGRPMPGDEFLQWHQQWRAKAGNHASSVSNVTSFTKQRNARQANG